MSEIDIQTAKEYLTGVQNRIKNEDSEVERLSKLVFDIAIQSLEKQVPQKPITLKSDNRLFIGNMVFGKGCKFHKCNCGGFVRYKQLYCSDCGQKLDWGDSNE